MVRTTIWQVHFYVHIKQLHYLYFYYWKITTVNYSFSSQNTISAALDGIICVNRLWTVIWSYHPSWKFWNSSEIYTVNYWENLKKIMNQMLEKRFLIQFIKFQVLLPFVHPFVEIQTRRPLRILSVPFTHRIHWHNFETI